MEHYLTGDHLMFEYDPPAISSVLSLLTPDRANIMVLSQNHTHQCKLKERWFGTKYCVEGEDVHMFTYMCGGVGG